MEAADHAAGHRCGYKYKVLCLSPKSSLDRPIETLPCMQADRKAPPGEELPEFHWQSAVVTSDETTPTVSSQYAEGCVGRGSPFCPGTIQELLRQVPGVW